MFGRDETGGVQKTTILVACLIGLGCCILAVLDARSQQAEDAAGARPGAAMIAGRPEMHHMHGWSQHRDSAVQPTLPGETKASGLS